MCSEKCLVRLFHLWPYFMEAPLQATCRQTNPGIKSVTFNLYIFTLVFIIYIRYTCAISIDNIVAHSRMDPFTVSLVQIMEEYQLG